MAMTVRVLYKGMPIDIMQLDGAVDVKLLRRAIAMLEQDGFTVEVENGET